jgi:hypothetical protein
MREKRLTVKEEEIHNGEDLGDDVSARSQKNGTGGEGRRVRQG